MQLKKQEVGLLRWHAGSDAAFWATAVMRAASCPACNDLVGKRVLVVCWHAWLVLFGSAVASCEFAGCALPPPRIRGVELHWVLQR